MTYCLAIKVDEGMVFASDSRTNAGLDDYNSYSKMFTYSVGDRCIVLLTSGNLSTSQNVFHRLETDLENPKGELNLNTCNDLEEIANYIGKLSVEYSEKNIDKISQGNVNFSSFFILGGQIKGQRQKAFLIYPEGNYILCSEDSPYFQIGETKYGKPILDRVIQKNTTLGDAARAALVSIDSTMRSDLTVGPPIDFVVYKNNNINLDLKDKLKLDTPYFMNLSDIWHEKIISSFKDLPSFHWEK
ncbi:MAG: 20S proteasome subunit A/B [Dehalococcoidia bacterium]|jgi:putative proteasome-type protease|nr:20S proteasome subunit A/B [Dehalococcoidia bacterium]MQG24497.1 20S proteasome subunit A/B [SAR202 cluster bacterium]MQG43777.1 20S proteasome subunit A/B [SAR202 cluster bacterium]|tara:strand:+ start:2191 stop:2922 length:732 start_codon:yes stop_codon:yes gene_type:complete